MKQQISSRTTEGMHRQFVRDLCSALKASGTGGSVTRLTSIVMVTLTIAFFASMAHAATFHVTTTADNGNNANPTAGSLRKAILDADANAGKDTIDFNIPGAFLHTISPPSSLPDISDAVVIDGYTQPGASENTLANGDNAVLLIELDGTNAGATADGLHIITSNCVIRGLVINRFKEDGMFVNLGNK